MTLIYWIWLTMKHSSTCFYNVWIAVHSCTLVIMCKKIPNQDGFNIYFRGTFDGKSGPIFAILCIGKGIKSRVNSSHPSSAYIEGILPKGPYPPCLRMADRALLAGYPRYMHCWTGSPSVEILAYHLFGVKLLSKPQITSDQSHPKDHHNEITLESYCWSLCCHSVQGQMCWH